MKNGPKAVKWRERKPTTPPIIRSQSIAARRTHPSAQNARRNYERYLELARAEAVAGNPVGAENYHQHAEHYFRSMCPTPETDIDE